MTAITPDPSTPASGESLKSKLERIRKQVNEDAGNAIDEMSKIATGLDLKSTAEELNKVAALLRSDTFRLIVAGRFKNGKSTLLNALLGRPTVPVAELGTNTAPMPMDDLPCTATLTSISYAEKPYVRVWDFTGKYQEWSLAKYLRESTVKDNANENNSFFQNIQAFDIGFPAELCKSGVILMDSPGLDDVPRRTEVTRQAVRSADAAVVVYKSDAFGGMSELEFVSDEIVKGQTRVFTVVNMFKKPSNEERFRRFVWDRLITEQQGGPAFDGQDFAARDIYFVNAFDALEGKMEDSPEKVASSGLALLERRLGDFLVTEKHYAHLQKFLHSANTISDAIDQNIAKREQGLQRETAELDGNFQKIQPQLAAIRARRDKLPQIFERYQREGQTAVQASFEQLIAGIRQDLPVALQGYKFKALTSITDRVSSSFNQKKIIDEGMVFCNEFITQRVREWGDNDATKPGVQQTLQPLMARLLEEIEHEIVAIESGISEAHFELTGWTVNASHPTEVVPMRERVISSVIGFVGGDIFTAMGGGSGGYKTMAASMGAFWGAVLLFGTGGVGLLIGAGAAIAINLTVGTAGLEKRAKDVLIDQVNKALQNAPVEAQAQIIEQTTSVLGQLQTQTLQAVSAVIDDEERNIRQIMEDNKKSMGQKTQIKAALESTSARIKTLRQNLKDVEVRVKQSV